MEVWGIIAGGLSFSTAAFDHGRFAMVWVHEICSVFVWLFCKSSLVTVHISSDMTKFSITPNERLDELVLFNINFFSVN